MSDKIKEMVEAHWSLIGVVVRSFLKQRKYSRFEPHKEDLMGVASIALVEAAERYDPNRLVLFRTYASARMRGKMQKEITKIVEKEHNEVLYRQIVGRETVKSSLLLISLNYLLMEMRMTQDS